MWPAIQPSYADAGPNGEDYVEHSLDNRGVGPARIESFRVKYRGRPVRNSDELGAACCGTDTATGAPQPRLAVVRGYVVGRVAGAGEHIRWLTVRFDTTGAPAVRRTTRAAYEAISRASADVQVRVCYCSVLDECWVSTGPGRPAAVRSCAAEAAGAQYR